MSDPAADPRPDAEQPRRSAARTLATRHRGALLGYTRQLCQDDRTARTLADEVFAETNSPTLQAFRRLPEDAQAELWRYLEETTRPAGHPYATAVPPVRLVRGFHDAYLQLYALHTPRRDCRQLVARLGDAVRRAHGDDHALEHHLTRCPDCAHARVDLVAIHTWQRPVLLTALLLWTGTPGPATPPPLPVHVPRAARQPAPPARAGHRRRPSERTLMIGLIVLGLAVLTVAAAARPMPSPGPPPASLPSPPPLRPTDPTPPTTADTADTADTGATGATATAATESRPPTRSATFAPSPTRRPGGPRLVNLRTGLCVAPGDGDSVHLETCTAAESQYWQFLDADGDGLHQIRNAADGRCLDGTTTGGNTVTVTLQACHPGRREQLWKPVPDRNPAALRLHFAPRATSSDYADHLLGPADIWPGPAKAGSPLVHQPNYYNKEDFLFAAS
ncbi:RICIN domain-containing protein [Kitasatospora sp. NPDC004240]